MNSLFKFISTIILLALACAASPAEGASIVIVGDDATNDQALVDYITNLTSATAGVTIVPFATGRYALIDDSTKKGELDNATLIIFGFTNSGNYNGTSSMVGDEKTYWNSLSGAEVAIHPFMVRSSRLAWFSQMPGGSVTYATTMKVNVPTDPAFTSITLTGGAFTAFTNATSQNGGAGTANFAASSNTGTVVAVDSTDNTIMTIARWGTASIGQKQYVGGTEGVDAAYVQGGPRTYFACPSFAQFNNLSPDGKKAFNNIILDYLTPAVPLPNAVKDWTIQQ